MNLLEQLLLNNQIYKDNFRQNKLFKIVKENKLNNNVQKEIFLNYFQIWSNEFQKIVLARVVFSEEQNYSKLAWHHLEEEFGHNLQLLNSRKDYVLVEDPIFEALASWFIMKMLTLGDSGRTVLIHLVIESCATIFYEYLVPVFSNSNKAEKHFNTHCELDPKHEQIGIDLLRKMNITDSSLLAVQKKGWIMIETLFARLAENCLVEA
ncbi:hypothetical protein [Rickettsia endosymbiont of Halotydeus destructor]|uniref:hypothetical protein n=1 Tax=Rickettsia endosymbiont of Halotydeus destructor TaxID=2996754 RepID=UPI003BB05D79